MADLLPQEDCPAPLPPEDRTPPLAFNRDGDPFKQPHGMVAWKMREDKGKPGRPGVVWGRHGIVHLSPDADMAQLRRAIDNRPGIYRLYPVDAYGRELEPYAVVHVIAADGKSLESDAEEGMVMRTQDIPDHLVGRVATELRFFDLYERMITSRDAHDDVLARMLTSLVTSTSTIQQSTAQLLNAATTTVRVANGVEALERAPAPALDIDGITDKLAAVQKLRDVLGVLGQGAKAEAPWFVQLLNGPVGMTLMAYANNLAKATAAAQAKAAQDAAQKAAAQPSNDNGE